ncbi:MAG TPA: methyltransferase domain-containing protein [Thermoanaerobaculia bacterium]|jgi:SAM-dependent methyltransferase|nr:methyltransferase domain-containing protein [Thermoanaerobaculia bacterium]
MSAIAKLVMRKFYRKAAGDPTRLPWHQEAPPKILVDAVAAVGRGRALDVGSGAGVFSVWLAGQGMDVTGIDLFPEAVAMGEARAREHAVRVNFIAGDLFSFEPPHPFDLAFDSGCLHALVGGSVDAYKRQLLRWLAPRGEYVLGHWGKRHAFDWRPIGPRRRSEETVKEIFAPELTAVDVHVEDFETPLPFGPVVRGIGYRFRHA